MIALADRRAELLPPEPLTASEWAERYRVLPARGNAEPGPYDLGRTPYLREILDALGDDYTTEITVLKAPRVGASELARTAIGYWVDTSHDPILVVYPNQDSTEEEITERVAPMLRDTPRLARWTTGRTYDVSADHVRLVHTDVWAGWAGSPQALASRTIRYAVLDETDKYVRAPAEAPPDELAKHRTRTYGRRRKVFAASSPTTKTGTIWRLFSGTRNKRRWHCPCPSCGTLSVWDEADLRYTAPRDETPEAVLALIDELESGAAEAWIECRACGHELREEQRLAAVRAGCYVSDGYAPTDEQPRTRRVAYHVPAWISPWVTLAEIAAAKLRAELEHDPQDYLNGFRGLPLEQADATVGVESVLRGRCEHAAGVAPEWTTLITAGADTQAKGGRPYWYYVVRAWGPGLRSRLLAAGRAESEEQLLAATVGARFPVEGSKESLSPELLCVDSGGAADLVDGSTTDVVYRLAARAARVVAVKGHGGSRRPDRAIRASNVDYTPPGLPPTKLWLHVLDTDGLKDVAARLIAAEPVHWEESAAALEGGYLSHMSAEERTRIRVGKRWETRWANTSRRRCDYWDASIYALAGAKILRAAERQQRRPSPRPDRAAKPRDQERGARRAEQGTSTARREWGARIRERGGIGRRER